MNAILFVALERRI